MHGTNGEKASLSDAAGVASLLLGSGQESTCADNGVRDLATYVQRANDGVTAARPESIVIEQVPEALAELLAVVAATEEATGVFLEAAEKLDTLGENLPDEYTSKLSEITTSIYEASGFQDITGQRITKVRDVLKLIEDKVAKVTEAIGYQPDPSAPPPEDSTVTNEKDLLDGPALPEASVTQDDIDALFD